MGTEQLEVWMRGPIEGIIPELQPVAHALLQASEEVDRFMSGFPNDKLWVKPYSMASVGFHLQHLKGVLDRLFTYARKESLNDLQLNYLRAEAIHSENVEVDVLVGAFQKQIETSVLYLRTIRSETLFEVRGIGRNQIPTNVIGLLFHAAEHTQRHVGQLLVTSRVVVA